MYKACLYTLATAVFAIVQFLLILKLDGGTEPWLHNVLEVLDPSFSQRGYQDECFTPRRILKRTPPPSPAHLSPPMEPMPAVNTTSQTFSKRDIRGSSSPQQLRVKPKKKLEDYIESTTKEGVLGVSNAQQVQHECFTPRRTLKRTPPPKQFTSKNPVTSKQTGSPSRPGRGVLDSSVAKDLVDLVPPPPRWEIPRTPVITAATTQERLAMTEYDGGCSGELHPLLTPAQGTTDEIASNNQQIGNVGQSPTMLISEGMTEDDLHHGDISLESVCLTSPPVMGNQPAVVSPAITSSQPAAFPAITDNQPVVSPPISTAYKGSDESLLMFVV